MSENTEKDLCQISFETWWKTTFYPHSSPYYDDSVDNSNFAWNGWKAAWEVRGDLDKQNRR